MKKFTSRLSVLMLLLAVGFCSSSAWAQYRHHHHHYVAPRHYHYRSSNRVIEGIHTAESVAHAAMLGSAIHSMADYTSIRLGYNSATLRTSGNSIIESDNINGLNLGIAFGWYIGNGPVIIEPGVFYSQKGSKLTEFGVPYNVYNKVTMHMLEFPLVVKYEILSPNGGLCLQPFLGGYMGFGMGGKIDDGYKTYDTFDSYDNFDAGLRMGCGLGLSHLYLEVAYDLGLTDMTQTHYGTQRAEECHTGTLGFSVGVTF